MKKVIWMAAILLVLGFSGSAFAMGSGGEKLYKRCAGCHGQAGAGTPMAPKLAGSDFVKADSTAVKTAIVDGTTISGKNHPKTPFTDSEIRSLKAYLEAQ